MSTQPARQKLIEYPQLPALDINLRHLRALTAVASAGSISGAAEVLFRVSSAVTRSIAELEASLAATLCERHARGTVLTEHGQLVLVRAQRIEREFVEARTQLVSRGGLAASADVRSLFASILNGRRLAVFASLVDKRNMPAVAREFGLTQPAVSTALKDLESGLGLVLLLRSPRGLVPTAAGEILALHFRRVLAELRHILPDLAARAGRLEGSIVVGALPLGRTQVLPLAVAALLARHSGLHVATVEGPYDALAAGLRCGDLDFIFGALRTGTAEARDLRQEALFEDHLSVIARTGHPLAGAGPLDFDTLRRAAWVLSRRGSPSRELLEQSFRDARQPPPLPVAETSDLAMLRGLLLESDMLTAISAHQLRYEIQDGRLVVLDFPLTRTQRDIGTMQRAGALPSQGAQALLDELRQVVARLQLRAGSPA